MNLFNYPILLNNPRVWRTYKGGTRLNAIHNQGYGDNFPEEWVMSVISARNSGREYIENEGLSYSVKDNLSLKEIINTNRQKMLGIDSNGTPYSDMGLLFKIIDTDERLTLQVHPTKEQAKIFFDSNYGKTECWHILDTCQICDEDPCVYLGFKPGMTKEKLITLFETQNISGMLNAMNKFNVKKGDTIFVKGGIPHAIGAGCFLAEIQEPTDYTIRIEKITPTGLEINENMMHQGLGFDKMFECFDYSDTTKEEIYNKYFIRPKLINSTNDGNLLSLLDKDVTTFFSLEKFEVFSEVVLKSSNKFAGIYILEGNGSMIVNGESINIKKGQQYFLPASVSDLTLESKGNVPLVGLRFFGK